MSSSRTILSLRVFLAVVLAACIVTQVLLLPLLSGSVAETFPEVAHLRWPVLVWSILMVLLGEIVVVGTWRLLDAVRQGRIFSSASFPWVNRITGAFQTAGVALLVGLVLLVVDGTVGPISVHLLVFMAGIGCFGLAALMVVLRALLQQATELRADMDAVI